MPTSSTIMSATWNPRTILGVNPGSSSFTCVGETKKGDRCRNLFFSYSDLAKANEILDRMALHRPSSDHARRDLTELAELTLCPRWHRKSGYSQVSQIRRKWQEDLERYSAELQSVAVDTVQVETMFRRRASHRRPRAIIDYESSNPDDNVNDEGVIISTGTLQPVAAGNSSSSIIISTPRSASPSSSYLQLLTPPATPEPTSRLSRISPTRRISSPVLPIMSTPPVSRTLSVTPAPATLSISGPRIVRRKMKINDCPICWDDIFFLEDAVWCQAQCGQNFHQECFKEWEKVCPTVRVKCAFCRAEWKYDKEQE